MSVSSEWRLAQIAERFHLEYRTLKGYVGYGTGIDYIACYIGGLDNEISAALKNVEYFDGVKVKVVDVNDIETL